MSYKQNRIRIPAPPHGLTPEVERQRLLNRVASLYQQTFQEDPTAREALAHIGLNTPDLFQEHRVGWANGTLLNTIPAESELCGSLKALGLLDGEGKEYFDGCAVFPWFTERGDCAGLWGLRVKGGQAVSLKGLEEGVWNWQALKRGRSVVLVPSILDALYLCQMGFKETIPVMGETLSQEHLRLMERYGTKEAYVALEGGAISVQLQEAEIAAYPVKLPPLPVEAAVVESLLKEANPKTAVRSEELKKREAGGYERTEIGFAIQYGQRRYEVKGVERAGTKLKATLKAYPAGEGKRFHLDGVDLYSHRSRVLFSKACAAYFGEKEEVVQEDLGKIIELAEKFEPEETVKAPAFTMTQEQANEALAFLKDPKLLTRILEDFDACGLAGEEGNKLMGYLAAVSRKLDDPLSVLIQSRSAAGKSTLQEAILRFVPPEDFEKYTRLTGQALFYKDENGLSHKLLAVEEEAGARDASYSIRNLQSSKFLSIATTEKDPVTGRLRTVEYRVKGPVALMLTTTSVDMDYETQNRFITLTIDESREMTERILAHQRELETVEGLKGKRGMEGVVRKHQNAQRLLKPLAVVNPYALRLTFPAGSLRARRDHKKYLGLIKAIAFLHQHQREVKTLDVGEGQQVEYIEATEGDIERANALAGEVLGQTVDELSAPGRALLGEIRKVAGKAKEARFTRRAIREACGWSDFQVKTHLGELVELEYLWAVAGRKGKEYVYELAVEGAGSPRLEGLKAV